MFELKSAPMLPRAAALGALSTVLLWVPGLGGASQKAAAFDAVSIRQFRPALGTRPHGLQFDPVELTAEGITLRRLILVAYGLQDDQLLGGADWTRRQYFAIRAATAQPAGRTQMLLMLRQVLASRFGLTLSQKNRRTPVYALVVAPGGLRVGRLGDDQRASYQRRANPGEAEATVCPTVACLVGLLNNPLSGVGRPVVDHTGLTGRYNFDLFLPARDVGGHKVMTLDVPNVQPAIREQFGLELKPVLISRAVLTVLTAHPPTPN